MGYILYFLRLDLVILPEKQKAYNKIDMKHTTLEYICRYLFIEINSINFCQCFFGKTKAYTFRNDWAIFSSGNFWLSLYVPYIHIFQENPWEIFKKSRINIYHVNNKCWDRNCGFTFNFHGKFCLTNQPNLLHTFDIRIRNILYWNHETFVLLNHMSNGNGRLKWCCKLRKKCVTQ